MGAAPGTVKPAANALVSADCAQALAPDAASLTVRRVTLATEHTAWPLGRARALGVHEDRCAADPAAPMKDWVYETPALGFVLSGWFDYISEGRAAFAVPGAIVLGNTGEHFNVRHHDRNGNKRLVVLMKQPVLDEIANEIGLDAPRFRTISFAPGPEATRMFSWMRIISEGGDTAEEYEYMLAHAALAAPVWRPRRMRVSAQDHKRAFSAARHIETHFHERCSLATLADLTNSSRYQLIRAFSAIMGQSPNQYLINTRIRAAAELLRDCKAPITQIALDVGFNDISHFYTCFKAAFGATPRQWRLAH